MFMWRCFRSHLVLPFTIRHQNRPILSCLSLWDGAFSRILYFGLQTGTKTNLVLNIFVYGVVLLLDVQTGNKTNLSLVVYVYRVVLLVALCTSVHKQAPKTSLFLVV